MASDFSWFSVSRKGLAGVLVGEEWPASQSQFHGTEPEFAEGVEFLVMGRLNLDRPFSLMGVVISPARSNELLAWLVAFSPEAFPISQYTRVLAASDARLLLNADVGGRIEARGNITVWASLILGEMLGQGESELSLSNIPLSRSVGCYSFAVARSASLYRRLEIIATTHDRLSELQRDSAFVTKPISADSLLPMWLMAYDDNLPRTSLEAVQRSADALFAAADSAQVGPPEVLSLLSEGSLERLSTGTAESRVVEFERIANAVGRRGSDAGRRIYESFVLAAASFLVGNGSSHVSLLHPYAEGRPDAYAWFGLLCGFTGPRSWDAGWLRAGKAIERQLRAGFSVSDPPSADVCWPEYSWARSVSQSLGVLRDAPKLNPRLLTIEVLPGCLCQMRSEVPSAAPPPSRRAKVSSTASATSVDGSKLDSVLARLDDIEALIRGFKDLWTDQRSLFDTAESKSSMRGRRSKSRNQG